MKSCVGVVLAGGRGRRLGRTKGDLEIDGTALADRAASILWPFCSTVLISTGDHARNPAPRFTEVRDQAPSGRGPLAGIAAAFHASGQADLLVLACDYPRVGAEIILPLLDQAEDEKHDLFLAVDPSGRDHPLVAVWKRSAEYPLHDALARGTYRVRSLLPDLRSKRLGSDQIPGVDLGWALLNLNWPDDLEQLG